MLPIWIMNCLKTNNQGQRTPRISHFLWFAEPINKQEVSSFVCVGPHTQLVDCIHLHRWLDFELKATKQNIIEPPISSAEDSNTNL